jgi:hypothetical protein
MPGFALDSEGRIRAMFPPKEPRKNDDSSSGSGDDSDDFSEAEAIAKKKELDDLRWDKTLQTEEEADRDDEDDFLKEAAPTSDEGEVRKKKKSTGVKRLTKKKTDKEKGKAVDMGADSDSARPPTSRTTRRKRKSKKDKAGVRGGDVPLGSEFEEESEGEGDVSGGYTRGPIPSACKEEALQAREDFNQRLEEIAKDYNRPLHTIQELVGEVSRVPRKKMMWNMYQQWYARHGAKTKPDGSEFLV